MANNANIIRDHQRMVIKEIQNFITIMGVEAVNYYKKSFRDGGFTDESLRRWKPRKGEITGGIAKVSKKSKGSRAILVKSGELRRSIRVVRKNLKSVTIGSDLPYAQIHNDGGVVYKKAHKRTATRTVRIRGSGGFVNGVFTKGRAKKMEIQGVRHNVGSSSFKMPKRQFVGVSKQLSNKLMSKLDIRIKKIFK